MKEENIFIIPAVMRTLDILENMFVSTEAKSLVELSKELKIPKASLFRILKCLSSRDYVTTIEETPYKYQIGYKSIQLVTEYRERYSYNAVVKPIMKTLTIKTKQTAQYAVFQNNQFYYIQQVLSSAELNYIAQLYKPLEINASAGAKIIFANLSKVSQEHYLSTISLQKRTENTIVDIIELKKDIEFSHQRGYALDNEEFSIGTGCMAVAVYNKRHTCVGAIGVTGQISEYRDLKNFNYILSCLQEAAESITKNLLV